MKLLIREEGIVFYLILLTTGVINLEFRTIGGREMQPGVMITDLPLEDDFMYGKVEENYRPWVKRAIWEKAYEEKQKEQFKKKIENRILSLGRSRKVVKGDYDFGAADDTLTNNIVNIINQIGEYFLAYRDCINRIGDIEFSPEKIDGCVGSGQQYIKNDMIYLKE